MSHDSFHSIAVRSAKKNSPKHGVNSTRVCLFVSALLVSIVAFNLCAVDRLVTAQGTFPDPNAGCPHATCGEVSPLDSDAEHGSGSHGPGLEEKFDYAKNIVSREVSGVHAKRRRRSRISRPGHCAWSI